MCTVQGTQGASRSRDSSPARDRSPDRPMLRGRERLRSISRGRGDDNEDKDRKQLPGFRFSSGGSLLDKPLPQARPSSPAARRSRSPATAVRTAAEKTA